VAQLLNSETASPARTDGTQGARVAVDVGGTFTDVIVSDTAGRLWARKLLTTAEDLGRAVVEGVQLALRDAGVEPADVVEVVHGSTTGTNAILERNGPLVGLLTTEGFRDVLEIARIRTPRLYDLTWEKPVPLVARRHRLEVRERIDAGGRVVVPLDVGSVDRAVERLLADGVNAIAVCLINAYASGEHERRIGERIAAAHPDLPLSLSSEVLPEVREYERTSTTVVNAFLQPVMESYLGELEARLRAAGIDAELQIMRSDGGVMAAAAAARRPVSVVISGPAAGVRAAQQLGDGGDTISFDMGGTTAKAAVVEGGRIPLVNEYEVRAGISMPSRFVKSGGYLLMVPAVDLAEVGNGAGSIASVDAGGALRVGPRSAGASPGPACYGRGGTEATITDANVWLGYLNPASLVGGDVEVDAALARRAIEDRIAKPLGMTVTEAAWGIHCVANSNMRRALRAVTVERGRDPRDFALTAFGGSGPVHAAGLADDLGIGRVVVPSLAGLLSSVGMLLSDVEHSVGRSWIRPLDDVDPAAVDELFDELQASLRAQADGHAEAVELVCERIADLRYAGQASVLSIPYADDLAALAERFEHEHRRTYGHRLAEEPVELVGLRLLGRAPRDAERRLRPATAGAVAGEPSRRAYFGEAGFVTTPLVGRSDLSADPRPGPLIVEDYDTTVVVPPWWTARLDRDGGIVMEVTR